MTASNILFGSGSAGLGGVKRDYASSIEQTSDGGYIVAGSTASSGAGGLDFWVIKLDNSGNQQWDKTFGGAVHDIAASIQQTSDGGFIVTGRAMSFGVGDADLWVIKLDNSGNQQWEKRFGGSMNDDSASVRQTSDGGYIVAGYTMSFGAGDQDFWVLKLDSAGNQQWDKTFGGAMKESAASVRQTSDGGYIVAGDTESFGAGGSDFWILKLDSNGNFWTPNITLNTPVSSNNYSVDLSWTQCADPNCASYLIYVSLDPRVNRTSKLAAVVNDRAITSQTVTGLSFNTTYYFKIYVCDASSLCVGSNEVSATTLAGTETGSWAETFVGTNDGSPASIQQTDDGGYIMAGSTRSTGPNRSDIWVLKLDGAGNRQWDKTFGGENDDRTYSIQQTNDGGYIVACHTQTFVSDLDLWILKLDSAGNPQWDKTFGGENEELIFFIRQTSDGGYIVAGYTESFGSGGGDFWVLKLDPNGACTGPGCP